MKTRMKAVMLIQTVPNLVILVLKIISISSVLFVGNNPSRTPNRAAPSNDEWGRFKGVDNTMGYTEKT